MKSAYKNLAIDTGLHFIIMYAVMYTMVDTFDDIYINANNFYMTGMMAAPMVLIMLVSMKHMFPDKKINSILFISSLIIFVLLYVFERKQTFIGDEQFIKSMIPHHSGAILMCGKSNIQDAELKDLCEKIMKGQRQEIDQMKAILSRLKN